ncbi:hypothetical protein V8G57_17745 [Collimonas sp. H4R21]|uniref:Inclusion body protein n=1 Tax=Collimonas rhizosphaerae TaxID=3126357 RepID=A0ABU9PZ12_9BURK
MSRISTLSRIVDVLVIVNVGKAIATNNLSKYVFMVDTTGYSGDGSEGGNGLITTCHEHDTIVWTVASIDPAETIRILGFSGQAIPDIVHPRPYPQHGGTVWGGRVNEVGTKVQYTMTLLLAGSKHLTFDPFITATRKLEPLLPPIHGAA